MGIWVVGLLSAIPYGLAYQYQEVTSVFKQEQIAHRRKVI